MEMTYEQSDNKTMSCALFSRGACPECGSVMRDGGGCPVCTECGYSKCS